MNLIKDVSRNDTNKSVTPIVDNSTARRKTFKFNTTYDPFSFLLKSNLIKANVDKHSQRSQSPEDRKHLKNLCLCKDILIVDDDMNNITTLGYLLKRFNINDSDYAMNGLECLKKVKGKLCKIML